MLSSRCLAELTELVCLGRTKKHLSLIIGRGIQESSTAPPIGLGDHMRLTKKNEEAKICQLSASCLRKDPKTLSSRCHLSFLFKMCSQWCHLKNCLKTIEEEKNCSLSLTGSPFYLSRACTHVHVGATIFLPMVSNCSSDLHVVVMQQGRRKQFNETRQISYKSALYNDIMLDTCIFCLYFFFNLKNDMFLKLKFNFGIQTQTK